MHKHHTKIQTRINSIQRLDWVGLDWIGLGWVASRTVALTSSIDMSYKTGTTPSSMSRAQAALEATIVGATEPFSSLVVAMPPSAVLLVVACLGLNTEAEFDVRNECL
jgi:hypothetical protein